MRDFAGLPVIFRMDRGVRRGMGKTTLSSGHDYAGIIHSVFTQTIKSRRRRYYSSQQGNPTHVVRAKIYCAKTEILHTTDLRNVRSLDGKDFDPQGLLYPTPDAAVRCAPQTLVLNDDYGVRMIQNIDLRCRAEALLTTPPHQWTVDWEKWLKTQPRKSCHLCNWDEDVVRFGHWQIDLDDYQGIKIKYDKDDPDKDWMFFDPGAAAHSWEDTTTQLLVKALEKYHEFVKKFKAHIKDLAEDRKAQRGG